MATLEEIKAFASAEGRTEQEIYDAAVEHGVTSAQLEEAMSWDAGAVDAWTANTGQASLTPTAPTTPTATEGMYRTADIKEWASQEGRTEKDIYDFAKEGGIQAGQLEIAMGWQPGQASQWVESQGLEALKADDRDWVQAQAASDYMAEVMGEGYMIPKNHPPTGSIVYDYNVYNKGSPEWIRAKEIHDAHEVGINTWTGEAFDPSVPIGDVLGNMINIFGEDHTIDTYGNKDEFGNMIDGPVAKTLAEFRTEREEAGWEVDEDTGTVRKPTDEELEQRKLDEWDEDPIGGIGGLGDIGSPSVTGGDPTVGLLA